MNKKITNKRGKAFDGHCFWTLPGISKMQVSISGTFKSDICKVGECYLKKQFIVFLFIIFLFSFCCCEFDVLLHLLCVSALCCVNCTLLLHLMHNCLLGPFLGNILSNILGNILGNMAVMIFLCISLLKYMYRCIFHVLLYFRCVRSH